MPDDHIDPLFGAAPAEIPLPSAPLVSVLCQVRFTEILSVQQKSFIASFQERVRAQYPLLQEEKIETIELSNRDASVRTTEQSVWRFFDAAREWRITLTPQFFSIETKKYKSRNDFVERIRSITDAVNETIKPTHLMRIGVRYIDRVVLNNDDNVSEMLNNEIHGVSGNSLHKHISYSISEVLLNTKEGQLLSKWGLMPPLGTHDPENMPPLREKSWFLDLDSFFDCSQSPVEFNSKFVGESVLSLSTRAYSFFRWAVTDAFLKKFGGNV